MTNSKLSIPRAGQSHWAGGAGGLEGPGLSSPPCPSFTHPALGSFGLSVLGRRQPRRKGYGTAPVFSMNTESCTAAFSSGEAGIPRNRTSRQACRPSEGLPGPAAGSWPQAAASRWPWHLSSPTAPSSNCPKNCIPRRHGRRARGSQCPGPQAWPRPLCQGQGCAPPPAHPLSPAPSSSLPLPRPLPPPTPSPARSSLLPPPQSAHPGQRHPAPAAQTPG